SAQYGDSVVFLASQNKKGIYVWRIKEKVLSVINDSSSPVRLKDLRINRLFLDQDNVLWIVCDDILSKWDLTTNKVSHFDIRMPGSTANLHILMDIAGTGNRKWLAVYGVGIVEIDNDGNFKRLISSRDGITNLGLYKVFNVSDSLLIATSNDGLFIYNENQRKLFRYASEDGLHSANFEETSGAIFGSYLFVGGIHGFTRVNLDKLLFHYEVPVCYFNGIRLKRSDGVVLDTTNLFLRSLEVPNDVVQVSIHFTGLYLSGPEKLSFRYRIKNIESGWIDVKNKTFVDLIGLYPGTYDIEIVAYNENMDKSRPIVLTLIFLPKWYQTWWFRSMVALLLMGILYGLYRLRLSQIRKEQQIRQRIASDLHDDIGSTLNSVKVFTNLAIMKPENNISYLEQLKEGVQGAIVGVRDMVWVLDDKQDTVDHLVGRIELFINPLATAQHIVFEKSVDATLADRMLRKEEKRNLYLIIKEALNNSIKYSSASTLQLRIYKSSHDKCCIAIQDNGVGFDLASVQRGNGLNNLQFRAQQIRYSIVINTAPGKGTLIVLSKS
ncbi:MAG: hypothetical protein J7621_17285, partial [Niastella sp.]|nr:hypothetical protein [Niastella sp.]